MTNEGLVERFFSKVTPCDGCWIWRGNVNALGYARLVFMNKNYAASRIIFELYYGPIPHGMYACHICDTPRCVNPEHLFIGTAKDNVHDAWRKGRATVQKAAAASRMQRINQESCKRGHPLAGDNLYLYKNHRGCRTCRKQQSISYVKRKRIGVGSL